MFKTETKGQWGQERKERAYTFLQNHKFITDLQHDHKPKVNRNLTRHLPNLTYQLAGKIEDHQDIKGTPPTATFGSNVPTVSRLCLCPVCDNMLYRYENGCWLDETQNTDNASDKFASYENILKCSSKVSLRPTISPVTLE